MNYIILDLEATCWEQKDPNQKNEIIEIGALKVNEDGIITDEFARFVKPSLYPVLSDFCRQLTSIKQKQVDEAETFPEVIQAFQQWINLSETYVLCSWGHYDKHQLIADCTLHQLDTRWVTPHISLKHQHAELRSLRKPLGMDSALRLEGLELKGTHHRGIDDARNITELFLLYQSFWEIPGKEK